ncbi:MAG TPA: tRNA 2-thiouridine(34) synthase MnmA [Petrotogaceae bacterium]|nr:tRNA 2-thiouridine(34) synthase MnmA [Petrotogaceae bacterium]
MRLLSKNKVLLLMSGGVDSSVAAYLLKEEGYDVVGLHFKTVPDKFFEVTPEKNKICCSPSDTYDAQNVAKQLNISDFFVVEVYEDFRKKVIDYFLNSYKIGITPNPCVVCNRYFKFGKAVEIARKIGAEYVSSGHYVINEYSEHYKTFLLRRGMDSYKDQSYFLSQIRKEYLDFLYFPLGKLFKPQIREIAASLNLTVANKPDSQEICFIPDENSHRFLSENSVDPGEGNIIDLNGKVIGKHRGYTFYTIGQRNGLLFNKAINQRLHVYSIDPHNNTLVVAPTDKLYSSSLIVNNLNFFTEKDHIKNIVCRIRKKSEEKKASIFFSNDDTAEVVFEEPIFAITPGQFAVFYDYDGFLLGSGEIIKYGEVNNE